jgi:2-methylaconitate cis-trans-isomerase PrpF
LAILGSPDLRQIDGLGGGDSLTSKVAIINASSRTDADVDYTFGQVSLDTALVDYSANCGNISSGVGPFAIDEGLVRPTGPDTEVRIFNTNTERLIVAHVPVVGGKAAVEGSCVIPGVPGSGARILLDFPRSEGSVTGSTLPTGFVQDTMKLQDGSRLPVSIVDAGNPCVFVRAEDLGIAATSSPQQIDANRDVSEALEEIRSRAAEMIGLVADWRSASDQSPAVPKVIVISQSSAYQASKGREVGTDEVDLIARAMSMQRAHKAYPITGAICTGVAAHIDGTLVHEAVGPNVSRALRIGNPAGVMEVEVVVEQNVEGLYVQRATVERTARRILSGYAYIPVSKLDVV